MTRFGIDKAWGNPSIESLKSAGVTFVAGYFSSDPSKNLDRAYCDELTAAGIDIVAVFENGSQDALDGANRGAENARIAQAQARACGMPEGRPIYFAVDFDASPGDQAAINAYLEGAASVLGGADRVGPYGSYYVCQRALNAGVCKYAWQTYAWSGGLWEPRAHLIQYSNSHNVGGVDCDFDRALAEDFGQWKVGQAPNPQPAPAPAPPVPAASGIFNARVSYDHDTRTVTVTADPGQVKSWGGRDERIRLELDIEVGDANPRKGQWTGEVLGAEGALPDLAVNGKLDPATIETLQRVLKVGADGKLGPVTISALQSKVGAHPVDGLLGPITIKALQRKLGVSQDGRWDSETTKALQEALNGGRF